MQQVGASLPHPCGPSCSTHVGHSAARLGPPTWAMMQQGRGILQCPGGRLCSTHVGNGAARLGPPCSTQVGHYAAPRWAILHHRHHHRNRHHHHRNRHHRHQSSTMSLHVSIRGHQFAGLNSPIAGGERESVEAFLLRLGLKDLGGWRFETIPDKKRVGKVNYIASNLKATCQIHRDCSLYASLRTVGDEAALRHLVSWLHGGHADKVDRAEHAARAAEMKISCVWHEAARPRFLNRARRQHALHKATKQRNAVRVPGMKHTNLVCSGWTITPGR